MGSIIKINRNILVSKTATIVITGRGVVFREAKTIESTRANVEKINAGSVTPSRAVKRIMKVALDLRSLYELLWLLL